MAQKLRPQAETLSGSPQPGFIGYQAAAIIAKRAPTVGDTGYPLGMIWVDKVGANSYTLNQVAAGVAVWGIAGTASTGVLQTLTGDSGGAISPAANNINLLGTANQIASTGAGSTITFSIPAVFVAPGSIASTTTLTAGTSLAVTTSATIGTTLGVTGATTLAALTQVGTCNINASGAAVTTIATGGTGALALGNATGNTALTGSFSTLTTAATFVIGTAGQTGTTTIVSSTAANSVLIQNGVNVGAQVTSINNGNAGADSTVNVLGGVATAGTSTLNLNAGTGAITRNTNIGTGAAVVNGINIGGTGANVIAIGNTQTAGSVSIGAAMISGTIAIGGTGLQVGTITLGGGTGAQTVNVATGGTGVKTVHIADSAVANIVTIGSTTGAAITTINGGTLGVNVSSDFNLTSVATKISLNGGAVTDFIGQATLTNGTVSVANTNIAAADRIFVTRSAKNGSTAYGTFITGITASTSFTITSAKSDTTTETGDASTVDYIIFRQT